MQQLDVQIAKQQTAAQAFLLQKQQLKDQLAQLDTQLEEDAMQKMIWKLICMHWQ